MDILHREYLKQDLSISVSENMNEIPYVQDFEEGAHNSSGTKFQENFINNLYILVGKGAYSPLLLAPAKGLGDLLGPLPSGGNLFFKNKEN